MKMEVNGAYSRPKSESGGHRVQRVPETEAQGRIHTSACTVAIMPEADEVGEVDLNPADLRIDTFRASGAGGSTSTRLTRQYASPTCPPASSPNVRMAARSTRTKPPPCACCRPHQGHPGSRPASRRGRHTQEPDRQRRPFRSVSVPTTSRRAYLCNCFFHHANQFCRHLEIFHLSNQMLAAFVSVDSRSLLV